MITLPILHIPSILPITLFGRGGLQSLTIQTLAEQSDN